ncbi:hypothetical protein BpHYR1_012133 [Brachionus plicatilis]|uniref:Uncharacterized protein n=1 Tax=Brachionus plicatilis TaxID=10195 RepID=A0A3M7R2I8_BRAPC|nr:hypothetical protein BpHYR1_012133 [Brachionus plicatilis]
MQHSIFEISQNFLQFQIDQNMFCEKPDRVGVEVGVRGWEYKQGLNLSEPKLRSSFQFFKEIF